MAGKKGRSGGRRPNAGRKPKEQSQALVEKLKPYEPAALANLGAAVEAGEAWAIKMFFEYMYGKPHQETTTNLKGELKVTPIDFLPE